MRIAKNPGKEGGTQGYCNFRILGKQAQPHQSRDFADKMLSFHLPLPASRRCSENRYRLTSWSLREKCFKQRTCLTKTRSLTVIQSLWVPSNRFFGKISRIRLFNDVSDSHRLHRTYKQGYKVELISMVQRISQCTKWKDAKTGGNKKADIILFPCSPGCGQHLWL